MTLGQRLNVQMFDQIIFVYIYRKRRERESEIKYNAKRLSVVHVLTMNKIAEQKTIEH